MTEPLLLACSLIGTLAVLIPWWRLATFPYQIDYGEGLMLEGALSLRQARPLYPATPGFPLVIHVYGPLAYAVTAATLRLNHLSFSGGRFLILLCALAISVLIATLLRKWTDSRCIVLSFGLILLTLPAFRFWTYLLRADLIGIAFSVSGLAVVVAKPKYKYWAAFLFAAALFCKYSLLAGPLAVFLHLLLTRQLKDAARFAILLGLICGAVFTTLQMKTAGGFAFHMFSTHPDPYSFTQFAALTALVWLSAPVVSGLALFHVVRKIRARDFDLPMLYFVTASITSLTAGKLGSTTNHFLEWMVACCLCAGMGYAALKSRYPRRLLPITVALILSLAAAMFLQSRPPQQPYSELDGCPGIYDYVSHADSNRILSQSLGPLLLAGKPVLLTDPFVYGQLVQHGIWSDGTLVRVINERYFDVILSTVDPAHLQAGEASIWPASLLDAVGRHYKVVEKAQCRDSSIILKPMP